MPEQEPYLSEPSQVAHENAQSVAQLPPLAQSASPSALPKTAIEQSSPMPSQYVAAASSQQPVCSTAMDQLADDAVEVRSFRYHGLLMDV